MIQIWRDTPKFNHEKLLSKIKINEENGCWEWQGWRRVSGYGQFRVDGVVYETHRLSFDLFKGIKEKYTVIDHICRNPPCINPDHLREVNRQENALENSISSALHNKNKTHCKRGHEFTDSNIQRSYGVYGGERRKCKKCISEYQARWYLKTKAAK